ncbi:MAG TPA: chemotaxis protein CheW, partial [Methylomirabilota bacterium]|nr:chemotaxis protein CheW [Methylomirabilota bacterium]
GADVDTVVEILPRLNATRIPGAMPFVAGLINVRGTLVTAVTGWRALGRPEPQGDADGITILLRLAERRLVALTVDDVVDLVSVPRGELQDRAALPGVDPVLVQAVGRRDGRAFVVLDTAALLAPVLAS